MKVLVVALFVFGGYFLHCEAAEGSVLEQSLSLGSELDNGIQRADFKCPFPFGAYADPESCQGYYICMMGKHWHRNCRNGFEFDILRRTCLPYLIAICGYRDKKTTEEPTEQPTEVTGTGEFICPSISGHYPASEDCSKFYSCEDFKSTLNSCPENQLFEAVRKECLPADQVNCGDRFRPGTTTSDDNSDEQTVTHTNELTTEKHRETAPPETDCDEEDVDCIIDETGDPDDWFTCPDNIGSYPHPSSDKLFIFCMNKIPSVKKCGMNLIFSKEKKTCVEVEVEDES